MLNRKSLLYLLILVMIVWAAVQQLRYAEYSIVFAGKQVSQQTKNITVNNGKVYAVIDIAEVSDDFIRIEGWGLLEGMPSKFQQVYIILKNEQDSIVLSALPLERSDVEAAFKSEDYRYSGYLMYFPSCKLKNGVYKIGFEIKARGLTESKWSDRVIEINNSGANAGHCDSLINLHIGDKISLQRYYYSKVMPSIRHNARVGYITDTVPFPFNDHRVGEALYGMAPVHVIRGLKADTVVGYFPTTKSLLYPENPLNAKRDEFDIITNAGNGIFVLRKKQMK